MPRGSRTVDISPSKEGEIVERGGFWCDQCDQSSVVQALGRLQVPRQRCGSGMTSTVNCNSTKRMSGIETKKAMRPDKGRKHKHKNRTVRPLRAPVSS